MNPVTIDIYGTPVVLRGFITTTYIGGGMAVLMDLKWPDGTIDTTNISVNLPDRPPLEEGQFYLKCWSEMEEVSKQLIEKKLLIPADHPLVPTGFTSAKIVTLGVEASHEQPH